MNGLSSMRFINQENEWHKIEQGKNVYSLSYEIMRFRFPIAAVMHKWNNYKHQSFQKMFMMREIRKHSLMKASAAHIAQWAE